MKIYQGICCLLLVMFLLIPTGCNKKKKPEGLPDVWPLTIKLVYDDGTPVGGAVVQMINTDKTLGQRWNTGGKTNDKGEAVMITYGEYPGAPEGNFKVIVNKEENVFDNADPPQIKERYNLIERKYTLIQDTPLTLEVKKDTKVKELTVGKAVREALIGPPG